MCAFRDLALFLFLLALAGGLSSCASSGEVVDEAKAAGKSAGDFPADDHDYFVKMDMTVRNDRNVSELTPLVLNSDEIKGRNTWMMWTGGNEAFWDWLANHSYEFLDLLKLVDFSPQNQWPRFGNHISPIGNHT